MQGLFFIQTFSYILLVICLSRFRRAHPDNVTVSFVRRHVYGIYVCLIIILMIQLRFHLPPWTGLIPYLLFLTIAAVLISRRSKRQ